MRPDSFRPHPSRPDPFRPDPSSDDGTGRGDRTPQPSALALLQQVLTGRDETERELLVEFARALVRGLDQSAPAVGAAVLSAQAAYAAAAAKLPKAPLPVASGRRASVLVVDDSPDVLVALGAFVEGAGFEALRAGSAEEALRVLAANPGVQVLVTDLAMPGASGVDLVAQACAMRPGLPALVITGYPGADLLAGLPAGVEVLAKPFRKAEFVSRLLALLHPAGPGGSAASTVSLTV